MRAQDETNCITEGDWLFHLCFAIDPHDCVKVLFSDALKTAKELDGHFAATGELKGPLHGVPISFKDLSELVHEL